MKISLAINKEQLNNIVPIELKGRSQKEAARIATTSLLAIMKKRIFNDQGSVNASGTKLGEYSDSYLITREKKERRTNKNINLVFSGETSRELTLGVNEDENFSIGFIHEANGQKKNPNAAQKAEYLEDPEGLNYGDILLASDEEVDLWMEIFEHELFERI